MDKDLLLIIVASSFIFIAAIIWKLRWVYKKILIAEAEQQASEKK